MYPSVFILALPRPMDYIIGWSIWLVMFTSPSVIASMSVGLLLVCTVLHYSIVYTADQ